MVGLILVSHSRKLAVAAAELARQATGPELPVAAAGGTGEDHRELGTDALDILEAIQAVLSDAGAAVLMDMGSAVLSAQTALDLLDETQRPRVRLCSAPLVEGAIAAAVQIRIGSPLAQVVAAAAASLTPKQEQLGDAEARDLGPQPDPSRSPAQLPEEEIELRIENAHGLHLRPVAALLGVLAGLDAQVRVENLTKKRGPVEARSLVEIARLQLSYGDRARFQLAGLQAEEAGRRIRSLAAQRFGEEASGTEPGGPAAPDAQSGRGLLFTSSIGVAIGRPFWIDQDNLAPLAEVADEPVSPPGIPAELDKLARGLAAAVRALKDKLRMGDDSSFGKQQRPMVEAQVLIVGDPYLRDQAEARVREQRRSAARAWVETMAEQASLQEQADDSYFRERAADFRELGWLVLRHLPGASAGPAARQLPDEPFVLVCEELSPSLLDQVRSSWLQGVLQLGGGPFSHGSILARAAGIPCLGGARDAAPQLRQARQVAFDAGATQIWTDPDPATVAYVRERRESAEKAQAQWRAQPPGPAVTVDGAMIRVLANVNSAQEVQSAVAEGADGIGLLRVEFLFQQFRTSPDESAQFALLHQLLEPWDDRPVVIRLLDAGADKSVPFLGVGAEANPFLGIRGIRLLLRHPEFLRAHLRALLRLANNRNLSVMVPMVADAVDLLDTQRTLVEEHHGLRERGVAHKWPLSVGAMVETPAAALSIGSLAAAADFFSLGTNDLVQYLLCAERGHPGLGAFQDGLHSAVLKTIRMTTGDTRAASRSLSICGELAGDPEAIPLLLGCGLLSLSVGPRVVARTKAIVRTLHVERCRAACETLVQSGAVRGEEVRRFVRTQFPELAAFGRGTT
ncbi:MAG: phosphoenolpyruvate--protein phosphotransferase [Verrucomicrobia bacterium]|nr:phosphoenolpyruvate--protein phosphotransferase [Verrucomicrobiota bacterium]